MGSFSAKLRVWNPSAPEKIEEIQAMVDTGAAFSWIHRERLERLGVEHLRRIDRDARVNGEEVGSKVKS